MGENMENMKDIIHDTIYTNVSYPHVGNNYILASNRILFEMGISSIDMICDLAKILEKTPFSA